MRVTPPAIALAALFAMVSSVSHSERPDSQTDPRSAALVSAARSDVAAGHLDLANDKLETALAVDPRNRTAFNALAKVALAQRLPGKAIRLYREALLIEPNDIAAISGQGEALVAKGALVKARENLARIKSLCVTTCAEQTTLAAAIDRGASGPAMSAQVVTPKPVVTDGAAN